jgi:hypothetical protein
LVSSRALAAVVARPLLRFSLASGGGTARPVRIRSPDGRLMARHWWAAISI